MREKHSKLGSSEPGIVLGISMGGYVSLDDMFLLARLDDVFWPCVMYIHILPNCCFIFQIFKMLLNFRFLF